MFSLAHVFVPKVNFQLTNDVQMDEMAHVWRGGHLTFVHACVAVLRILNLQHPVLRVLVMDGSKALVRSVCVATYRQQMNVAMSHPGHLQNLLLRQKRYDEIIILTRILKKNGNVNSTSISID